MKNKSITIVGCGLLGSMFANTLSAHAVSLGVYPDVTLIDFDLVEKRNSPANLMVPSTIGMPKVDVVERALASADIKVKKVLQRITEKNTWLLKGSDVIVGALDNISARLLLHQYAVENGIPYLDMGVSEISGVVSWTHSECNVDTMQYLHTELGTEMPNVEKKPACEVVATRLIAALVVECAAKSLFIYISGHDPFSVVFELTNKKAKNKDLVGWHIGVGKGSCTAVPLYLSHVECGGEDDSPSG